MTSSQLGPLAITVPIVVACVLLSSGRWLRRRAVNAIAAAGAAAVVGLDIVLLAHSDNDRVVTWVGGWTPVDGFGVGITLVATRSPWAPR